MMITLGTIREFKRSIALIGVLSFATVYGCDLFCDLGIISFSFTQHPLSEQHDHGDHHAAKHGHGHAIAEDQPATPQDESSESGCCDDLTNRFYSSLANQTGDHVATVSPHVFKVILTLNRHDEVFTQDFSSLIVTRFDHPPNGPPAIPGRYLRVLINSFLI